MPDERSPVSELGRDGGEKLAPECSACEHAPHDIGECDDFTICAEGCGSSHPCLCSSGRPA